MKKGTFIYQKYGLKLLMTFVVELVILGIIAAIVYPMAKNDNVNDELLIFLPLVLIFFSIVGSLAVASRLPFVYTRCEYTLEDGRLILDVEGKQTVYTGISEISYYVTHAQLNYFPKMTIYMESGEKHIILGGKVDRNISEDKTDMYVLFRDVISELSLKPKMTGDTPSDDWYVKCI